MRETFLVQNPHTIPVSKKVEIDGEQHSATLDGFEVYLLSQDGMSGTVVRRYYGAKAQAARELFVNDAIVAADFSLVSAPAAAEEPAAA